MFSYTIKEVSKMTGIPTITLWRKLKGLNIIPPREKCQGGKRFVIDLQDWPPDIQKSILIYIKDTEGEFAPAKITAMLPFLSPAAAENALALLAPPVPVRDLSPSFADVLYPTAGDRGNGAGSFALSLSLYSKGRADAWSPERAISLNTLDNHRVREILGILREVDDVPKDWAGGKRKWIEYIAAKNKIGWQTIYRWLAKYEKRGIAGVEHRKSTRDNPKAWTPEALNWWIGLCLKPEHRKINLKALYQDSLCIEAKRRNWRIGGLESAVWWYNKRATPAMLALQKGGMRALDDILPPILRDYSDLAPFEMLVGDQHRFDFWVVDDDTGRVFRPECFMWQDLRTRLIYGMAFDRHYDAHLCGLALRIGMRVWGCFNAIYTDNGRPELSKYMMNILAQIRSLGMEWQRTEDAPLDILDVDDEEIAPVVIAPGTHKKSIVKNAKAKMIEGTFSVFEDILRSRFRLSGSVKRLTDDIHTQDTDHQEAMKLAEAGRMLLASEFYLACYHAIDYYNQEKTHRGVRKEWAWKPRPATATPLDCLKACYEDGWRPKVISDAAADMIFLKKASRIVQRGRVSIEGETYEHDLLLELHGERVDVRYNPIEADMVLIYRRETFLCAAAPVEYSSMKKDDLAHRKILEKRARRKAIAEKFREATRHIPDFREYSQIPETEKVAAQITAAKELRRIEYKPVEVSQEELDAHIERMEQRLPLPLKSPKPPPARPGWFINDNSRIEWIANYMRAGGVLTPEDEAFKTRYFTEMPEDARAYWESYAAGE